MNKFDINRGINSKNCNKELEKYIGTDLNKVGK